MATRAALLLGMVLANSAHPAQAQSQSAAVSDTNVPASVARMFEHAIKIAPHVWALHAPLSSGIAPVAPNETLVEQRDRLVLIDAGKTRGAGKRIVALIRSISDKPVKAIILTHWHPDHVLGLGPIVEAWPSALVVADAGTAQSIATDPSYDGAPKALSDTAQRDAARAAAFRDYARQYRGKLLDPKLTPRQRQGWTDLIGVLDQRTIDEQGTYLVPPTRTFTGTWQIDDPDAPVEAIQIGQGHTDSDVAVWLPKQRVVAAGDLVVWPVPYGGSRVLEWPATLDRLIALRPAAVVPGHGDLLHGVSYLRTMRVTIASMDAKARALPRQPVLGDDAVRARSDVAFERKLLTGGDPWLGDLFDQSFADDVVDAYHELTGRK